MYHDQHQNLMSLILSLNSYSLIPSKLSLFPEMFGLEKMQKDIMPYKLYTIENVEKRYVPIEEALAFIEGSDEKQFKLNIEKWNLKKDISL